MLGGWRTIIVDDRFPCVKNGRGWQPLFARWGRAGKESWAMLIEKAFAKLHGSYSAIAGGLTDSIDVDSNVWLCQMS